MNIYMSISPDSRAAALITLYLLYRSADFKIKHTQENHTFKILQTAAVEPETQ